MTKPSLEKVRALFYVLQHVMKKRLRHKTSITTQPRAVQFHLVSLHVSRYKRCSTNSDILSNLLNIREQL